MGTKSDIIGTLRLIEGALRAVGNDAAAEGVVISIGTVESMLPKDPPDNAGAERTCFRCNRTITLRLPTVDEVRRHNELDDGTPRIGLADYGWADKLRDGIPFYCGNEQLHEA